MISERLEKHVDDMVDKGVHFEDAVRESESDGESLRPPERQARIS